MAKKILPEDCFLQKSRSSILIEQKGMTFDHDFVFYPPPLFLFPIKKKREEEKENKLAKIVIKGHAFLLDPVLFCRHKNYDF